LFLYFFGSIFYIGPLGFLHLLLGAQPKADLVSPPTSPDALSTSNLELLIATLLKRANYGLTAEDMGLAQDAKIPAVRLP